MVTFLFTSVVVLGLIAIAIYFWQKPANRRESIELSAPPEATSLFATEEANLIATAAAVQEVVEPVSDTNVEVNRQLPASLIESWRKSPDRSATAKLLHAAALSDDADTYRNAVEMVLSVWQSGGIPNLSATDLQALLNGEFWLLSSSTRSSGAGFILKRTLSRANRVLETANNSTNHRLPPVD